MSELVGKVSKRRYREPIPKKEILPRLVSELVLLVVTALILIPFVYFILGAFKDRLNIVLHPLAINAEMFTLVNFAEAWQKMEFFACLKNTSIITGGSLLLVILFGSLAGFVVARVERKIFTLFYSFELALMVVPFIGDLIPLVVLMANYGLYGHLYCCILIQTAWNLPFSTFLYTGFMRTLPKELEEAALIDGCSLIQTYWWIFLPLLAPVTATCCIRNGIGMWNDYLVSVSFLNIAKLPTLMPAVMNFFGLFTSEYGFAFAGIMMASFPILVMFAFLQKYFIKGMAAGAVKG